AARRSTSFTATAPARSQILSDTNGPLPLTRKMFHRRRSRSARLPSLGPSDLEEVPTPAFSARVWSAPAKRRGDGALPRTERIGADAQSPEKPKRGRAALAPALQMAAAWENKLIPIVAATVPTLLSIAPAACGNSRGFSSNSGQSALAGQRPIWR